MNASEIAKVLDDLAERLGPQAQAAFEVVGQRVFIENALQMCLGLGIVIISIAVFASLWRYTAKMWMSAVRKYKYEKRRYSGYPVRPDPFVLWAFRAIAASVFGMAAMYGLQMFISSLIDILSLDYATLIRILEAAGGQL